MRAPTHLLVASSLFFGSVGCGRSEGNATPAPAQPAQVPLAKPAASPASSMPGAAASPERHETVTVPAVTISDRVETTVHVVWDAPAGTAVNDDAPFRVRWTTSEGLAEVPPEMRAKGKDVASGFDVRVVAAKGAPEALLAGVVEIVVCDVETHSVCVPVKRRLEMPFIVAAAAGGKDPKPRREQARVALPRAK